MLIRPEPIIYPRQTAWHLTRVSTEVCGLSRPEATGTLAMLGETDAGSAGEQPAEGYPSRTVTTERSGRPSGLPTCHCSSMPEKTPAEGGTNTASAAMSMWQEFPEKRGKNSRNPHE